MNWMQPDNEQPERRSLFEWLLLGVLTGIAVTAAVLLWTTPARGQDPAPIVGVLSRDAVYVGDSDRDFTVLWSRGDPNDGQSLGLRRWWDLTPDKKTRMDTALVNVSTGLVYPVTPITLRHQEELESWYWQAIRPLVPAGQYRVTVNDRTVSALTVMTAAGRRVTRLTAGERQSDFIMAPNSILRGHGCTLRANLVVAPGCNIVGLTIEGNVTGSFDNCVFDQCVFRNGKVGPFQDTDRQVMFKDCVFRWVQCWQLNSGLFLRCKWHGTNGHAYCTESAQRLAMVDCLFDRTDRGLVLRPRFGDNSNNLYAGIWFRDIALEPNGSELVCVEGGPFRFDRNLFFGLRQSSCVGSFLLYSSKASYNYCNNIRIPVDITGMGEQIGNVVQDSECEYVRVNWPQRKNEDGSWVWNQQAVGTKLLNINSVGFMPKARNQATGDPAFWHDTKFQAVIQDGSPTPTTKGVNLTVRGQAAGFVRVLGVQE